MKDRYTVRQLAVLSGVSVRTLHHYDACGLLKPAAVGANRYRYYGEAELFRLQQILLHRSLRLALPDIAALLARHRGWVASMWGRPCSPTRYAGLSELYLSDPGFVARYEARAAGFAAWLAAAMKQHAARLPA